MKKLKILVVEDEGIVSEDIQKILEHLGYEVTALASSGEEALASIKEKIPDLVLMDIVLIGELDGVQTAEEIKKNFDIPVIYLTAYTDENTLGRAKITEPFGYITKPFEDRELHIIIEIALYKYKTEKSLSDSYKKIQKAYEELDKIRESLETKTKELESFTYTVSHDLKAPLVIMESFSSILMEEYKEKLGNEGAHYLERIKVNIETMNLLISDLLELSRAGRVVGETEETYIEGIIFDIQQEIAPLLKLKKIKLIIKEPLPRPWVDTGRIRQVFSNLIDNSIKFMREDEINPLIEIGALNYDDREGFYTFYVSDNGIGIAQQYHDKIFAAFERLKEKETQGAGIGLAIVKKIIEHHGGKVWLESEKGKGSKFYFNLPKGGQNRE